MRDKRHFSGRVMDLCYGERAHQFWVFYAFLFSR